MNVNVLPLTDGQVEFDGKGLVIEGDFHPLPQKVCILICLAVVSGEIVPTILTLWEYMYIVVAATVDTPEELARLHPRASQLYEEIYHENAPGVTSLFLKQFQTRTIGHRKATFYPLSKRISC